MQPSVSGGRLQSPCKIWSYLLIQQREHTELSDDSPRLKPGLLQRRWRVVPHRSFRFIPGSGRSSQTPRSEGSSPTTLLLVPRGTRSCGPAEPALPLDGCTGTGQSVPHSVLASGRGASHPHAFRQGPSGPRKVRAARQRGREISPTPSSKRWPLSSTQPEQTRGILRVDGRPVRAG